MCSVRYNVHYISSVYHDSSRQIWLSDVTCTGRETDFAQCRHAGWGIHNCEHSQDVSISCAAAGLSDAVDSNYTGNHFRISVSIHASTDNRLNV